MSRHAGHAVLAAARHAGAASASTAEQDDLVPFNLGGVALVAVLVVPLPCLEPAFDVDLFSLRQVLGQRLGDLSPEDDAVPFGLFLALSALIVPDLGRRHVERRHRGAARRITQLGVASEIADQNHLVYASHRASILL